MLFQLTMFPSSRKGSSVSADVARVIDMVDRSGLPYRTSPMSTSIEGSWDAVMDLINRARKMLRRRGHERIYISITIDDRRGAINRLTGKIESIEKRLKGEIKK